MSSGLPSTSIVRGLIGAGGGSKSGIVTSIKVVGP